MKPLSSFTDQALAGILEKRMERSDFPSFEHFIAWELAIYFNEPYGFWVRKVKTTFLLPGQVEHEFKVLQTRKDYTRREKAKLLMATLFPKSRIQTPPRGV